MLRLQNIECNIGFPVKRNMREGVYSKILQRSWAAHMVLMHCSEFYEEGSQGIFAAQLYERTSTVRESEAQNDCMWNNFDKFMAVVWLDHILW